MSEPRSVDPATRVRANDLAFRASFSMAYAQHTLTGRLALTSTQRSSTVAGVVHGCALEETTRQVALARNPALNRASERAVVLLRMFGWMASGCGRIGPR